MTRKKAIPDSVFQLGNLKTGGFTVFRIDGKSNPVGTYSRKDFYKICVITGENDISYAERSIHVNSTILFFGSSRIPYSWQTISREQEGYTCLFTKEFLNKGNFSGSLLQSPLFKPGGTPIFYLNKKQLVFINGIFKQMVKEYNDDYRYKDDIMRNYISLMLHEALKLQPSEDFVNHMNAAERVTTLFLELLEKQFPIEDSNDPLLLTTAQHFAKALNIHPNHLNRSVKSITGQTVTHHILERVIKEAKSLLIHTDWTIADIGYGLGFKHPTYFFNHFKKMTGTTPGTLRK